jgi:F420-non-reducing hydrogenase iron-sulfur subunit
MVPRKVILLTCNWNAYSGLETAGSERLAYPPDVFPVKVGCLGQVSTGAILKAFENGADGVLMLSCPPDQCRHEFGARHAEEMYAEARDLVMVLGYSDAQFQLDWVAAGEGQDLVNKVQNFVANLNGNRSEK